jgi:hypothetical protein
MQGKMKTIALIAFGACVLTFLGCRNEVGEPVMIEIYRQSFDETKPQCRLFLQGATFSDIRFENTSLMRKYFDRPARYEVYGSGQFMWRAQTIRINDGAVTINGASLPASEFKSFVVRQDGSVVSGYIPSVE